MKTKQILRNPNHYQNTRMTGVVYGRGDQKIRTNKIVGKSNGKVKIVTYSPVDYYGKQKKTKVVIKRGKVR